jgi:phosphohistidine phosphatase SixA
MKENNTRSLLYRASALSTVALLAFITVSALSVRAQIAEEKPMTIILVRHAEKKVVPPENKDPELSPAGETRAREIVRMFGGSGITAVYASQYKRTQHTVKPIAEKLGIPVTTIDAQKTAELVKQIRAGKPGQVVFIAGHNNTVPDVIAALGGPKMPIIPETEYDNLFILTLPQQGTPTLVKMKYGSPLPAPGTMVGPP